MTDNELKALVAGLATAQAKTDIQLAKMAIQSEKTDRKISELAEQHKKTDKILLKSDEQHNKTDKILLKSDEQHKKNDIRLEKIDKILFESAEQHKKNEIAHEILEKKILQVTTQLGNLGNIQGDIAEDLFRRNVVSLLKARGILIKNLGFRVKMPGTAEYDIVAENGKEIVVLEVKNKLSSRHIRRFLNVQLPKFRSEFPIYSNYKLYGAIGSLIISEELEQIAIDEGLFVFTQNMDGGASIINSSNFKAKSW